MHGSSCWTKWSIILFYINHFIFFEKIANIQFFFGLSSRTNKTLWSLRTNIININLLQYFLSVHRQFFRSINEMNLDIGCIDNSQLIIIYSFSNWVYCTFVSKDGCKYFLYLHQVKNKIKIVGSLFKYTNFIKVTITIKY